MREISKFVPYKKIIIMKKFLAFFASFVIVAVLALSVMSFTDDDPKKHKCENTAAASDTTKACNKAADATADTKKCCKEAGSTASADCRKSETCKHHKHTADAGTTENK